MADELYSYAVTIPPGTPSTAPQVTAMTMPSRIVRRIVVKVPPGPMGFMGFRIGATGVSIVPASNTQWIVSDDEEILWDVANLIQSGAFQLIGYNTGIYPHTVFVRFEVDIPQAKQTAARGLPLVIGSGV